MAKIEKRPFGLMPDGREVSEYTLTDRKGQRVRLLDFACAIVSIEVLDSEGQLRDVCLGYDDLAGYLGCTCAFGAIIGRYANRIGGGLFTLNGKEYALAKNNGGKNCLHGGPTGFQHRLFDSRIEGDEVVFTYVSADMEEGFPGRLTLVERASFRDGVLAMRYAYISDRDTIVNITNHNYFNLNGHASGSALDHTVRINADRFCFTNSDCLTQAPTLPVEGPFDLREDSVIASKLASRHEQFEIAGGFDHCFEVNRPGCEPAAFARGEMSGIELEVYSDMPAIQFYTGNNIRNVTGKGGVVYHSYDGICFESQQFPDAINQPSFPSPIVRANEPDSAYIAYKFSSTFER